MARTDCERWNLFLLTLLLSVGTATTAGVADEIKIGKHWYTDVTIQSIEDGHLSHINAAGTEISTALERIGGIKIGMYPELAKAQAAYDRRDDEQAVVLLNRLERKVRRPWLKHWVTYGKMKALTRRADALGTVNSLLSLARAKADAFFLIKPPVDVLQHADRALLADLQRRLTETLRIAGEPGRQAIRTMLEAALQHAERLETVSNADSQQPKPRATGELRANITLPSALGEDDPIASLLRRGRFEAALRQASATLERSSAQLARHLYERGVAKLHLAEKQNNPNLFKSAGLDFMRVVIYRPRHTTFVGPALMEAGVVHQRIERHDLAAKLFEKARLYIDQESEPDLSARLDQLIAEHGNIAQSGAAKGAGRLKESR